jgi:stage V sporulation protein AC
MDVYTKEAKKRLIKEISPGSKILKNLLGAFFFGALFSGGGEALRMLYSSLGASDKDAPILVSLSIITLASVLTAIGVFDKIARHAGAGTLVPISGFSNAVTSQAIDAKSEGYILGVGAKIFTVAGPVILYGLASGVFYGLVYYIVKMFGWS